MNEFREILIEYINAFVLIPIIFGTILSIPIVINLIKSKLDKKKG